jgi:Leucine-rich repeat (LRR) protein
MIIRIDPGTFEYLDRLEVLDLSINSLRKVPVELTELPHLRRLYLSDNDLRNEGLETMEKQIRSPLQILDISYNDIERIPRFGMMPLLETLVRFVFFL